MSRIEWRPSWHAKRLHATNPDSIWSICGRAETFSHLWLLPERSRRRVEKGLPKCKWCLARLPQDHPDRPPTGS